MGDVDGSFTVCCEVGGCVLFVVCSFTQVPLLHVPSGTELHGLESGKYSGSGQVPSELQGTVNSQSLLLPHIQLDSCSTRL